MLTKVRQSGESYTVFSLEVFKHYTAYCMFFLFGTWNQDIHINIQEKYQLFGMYLLVALIHIEWYNTQKDMQQIYLYIERDRFILFLKTEEGRLTNLAGPPIGGVTCPVTHIGAIGQRSLGILLYYRCKSQLHLSMFTTVPIYILGTFSPWRLLNNILLTAFFFQYGDP